MIWLIFTLGLAVGFLIGVTTRDAFDLIKPSRPARRKESLVLSTPAHRRITLLLVVTLLANMLVGVLLIITRKSAEDYSKCSAAWQQAFATGYQARYDAARAVDLSIDKILRSLVAGDDEQAKRDGVAYVALRDRQIREQAKNPLPPLPEGVCGKPGEVRR